ncbi:MAG: FliM/FliN family flagellar motor switch protein [Planctomycetia bacterium]|nr:FliM/FliN family flagellar motor switch protein [Planctomycetia bacterium]
MPELTAANIEQVAQACRDNLPAIGLSLNQCFGTHLQISAGEIQSYAELGDVADLNGPGLVVGFEVGSRAMLCAISASLPLPDWYRHPDSSQAARIDTLAQEWSFHCLPEELPGDNFVARTSVCLRDFIAESVATETTMCLPLVVETAGDAPRACIWLIWPVALVPAADVSQSDASATFDHVTAPDEPGAAPDAEAASAASTTSTPTAYGRLRRLPVPVIVKLAEKKIELGQLLGIGPGAIITFEKPCEDLLELYVNNQLYCRGEAVKIGEKFGIKICETGSVRERASALMSMESRAT